MITISSKKSCRYKKWLVEAGLREEAARAGQQPVHKDDGLSLLLVMKSGMKLGVRSESMLPLLSMSLVDGAPGENANDGARADLEGEDLAVGVGTLYEHGMG